MIWIWMKDKINYLNKVFINIFVCDNLKSHTITRILLWSQFSIFGSYFDVCNFIFETITIFWAYSIFPGPFYCTSYSCLTLLTSQFRESMCFILEYPESQIILSCNFSKHFVSRDHKYKGVFHACKKIVDISLKWNKFYANRWILHNWKFDVHIHRSGNINNNTEKVPFTWYLNVSPSKAHNTVKVGELTSWILAEAPQISHWC